MKDQRCDSRVQLKPKVNDGDKLRKASNQTPD